MANGSTTASSNVFRSPVAIGLPSPAAPTGQNHHFYQHLSPFTTTPSPNATAAATSTVWRWSPRLLSLLLRALALFLSFSSAIALAFTRPQAAAKEAGGVRENSFNILHRSEFRYCLTATIVSSAYLVFQLFKGIYDIAFKGCIVPERVSDYITFFFDQLAWLFIRSWLIFSSLRPRSRCLQPKRLFRVNLGLRQLFLQFSLSGLFWPWPPRRCLRVTGFAKGLYGDLQFCTRRKQVQKTCVETL